MQPWLLLGLCNHLRVSRRAPCTFTYGDLSFFSVSVNIYSQSGRAPCLHVCRFPLLLGLRDHVRVIGELPSLLVWRPRSSSRSPVIIYNQSESTLLARMPISASPRPPRSCTCYRRAPCLHVWRPRLLLGLRDHLQSVGEHPACTYGDLGFSMASVIMYSQSESTLLARHGDLGFSLASLIIYKSVGEHPACTYGDLDLLLGLRDHLQSVGEHPACTYGDLGFFSASVIIYNQSESTLLACMATSVFSMASVIIYNQSESTLLARMATSASPRPPWSCTCYRRAPCLHVWRPRLLLGLRDHLQSVGEHPACMYGDLAFFSVSVIIYNQSESTLLARMATSASPWPPWSSTKVGRVGEHCLQRMST